MSLFLETDSPTVKQNWNPDDSYLCRFPHRDYGGAKSHRGRKLQLHILWCALACDPSRKKAT